MIVPDQTIAALLKRLHASGCSARELGRVHAAYSLAAELFSGAYRGNGRPFVCHLVGTASAAAQARARFQVVLGGLLHAAFDQGVFPDGRSRLSVRHRRWLASRVGRDVAAVVVAYHRFGWGRGAIAALAVSPPADGPTRELLLLRLCNELDDMTDAGLALAGKRTPDALWERTEQCAALARWLGREELAATLEALTAENLAASWAAALPARRSSYRLPPSLPGYIAMRWTQLEEKARARLGAGRKAAPHRAPS